MIKKVFILSLLFMMIFGLTSCNKENNNVGTEYDVDVEFWTEFWANCAKNHVDAQYETERLHAQNETGYWGDLIPFYDTDEGKFYMYYMTGDTSDLANPKIDRHLATSTDMFNFTEVTPYEVLDNVTEAVNLSFYKKYGITSADFLDFETFPEGYRDFYFFFDDQVNRYRYLALCYYKAKGMIKCALGLGTSDDDTGLSWTSPIKIIQNYPLFKQPECPCAQRINGRWYLFCSLWGESIHNVGRFRYLVGEENKTLDEEDWLEKETYYLDGEDLCAAQVCNIGDHYLMYGWIVKCYENAYYKKTIDNGLWGGDMSLMREVYQLKDGTLGVRLPYGLKELMNKGELYRFTDGTLNNSNITGEGEFTSSLIIGEANIANNNLFYVTLTSNNKDYYVLFSNEESTTQIYIGCDKDVNHRVASSYICDKKLNNINFTIVVEDNVIEVFLNDTYSLSARTSMFSGTFERVTLECDGVVDYKNVTVNKLANSNNIFG